MAQPTLVPQGTLNRLLTSIQLPEFPALTTSVSYMGKRQVSITYSGKATSAAPTATGMVMSPEPFITVMIHVSLLRTQALAAAWRSQIETATLIGPITVYTDVNSGIDPEYNFVNCAVDSIGDIDASGADGAYNVTIIGTYPINSDIYVG